MPGKRRTGVRGICDQLSFAFRPFLDPDAIYQVFERGIVLANPGSKPQAFDLERLTPDAKYRRLTGRPQQDPQTNDGSTVQGLIVLSKDALFLERL